MLSDVFEHDSNFGSRPTHRTDQRREVESYAVADDTLQSHGIEHGEVLVNWRALMCHHFDGGDQTVLQDRRFVERGIRFFQCDFSRHRNDDNPCHSGLAILKHLLGPHY